jgi:hypothetical protein
LSFPFFHSTAESKARGEALSDLLERIDKGRLPVRYDAQR